MPKLNLYSEKYGNVAEKSGLNWGFSKGHVSNNDAYIAVPIRFFSENPDFFPPHGSIIDIVWDDGMKMKGLLEGTQSFNGYEVFKQISTFSDKSLLGTYLRNRLNVNSNRIITISDLKNYGRDYIEIERRNDIYYFDFSI